MPKGESPVVSEEKFAQPPKVRVLLEQRDSSRLFALRGHPLTVNGKPLQDSELVCIYEHCSAGAQIFSLPLVVTSSDEFVHFGKAFYRERIHLIAHKSRTLIINELDVEAYLVGLVNSEISSRYPREAIKAQVIAARSYALAMQRDRRKNKSWLYDLDSTEMDQVYLGAQLEDAMSHFVVRETQGQVLTHQNKIVRAYYHASSGGSLERPSNVWNRGRSDDQIYSTRTPPESDDAGLKWKITFGPVVGKKIQGVGSLRGFTILEKNSNGDRIEKIKISGTEGFKVMRGAELRKLFGARWLKSTVFSIEQNGNLWTLNGLGFGHGVGLSQLGAKHLAQKGWSSEKILASYYPGAEIKSFSASSPFNIAESR